MLIPKHRTFSFDKSKANPHKIHWFNKYILTSYLTDKLIFDLSNGDAVMTNGSSYYPLEEVGSCA